MKGFFEKLNFTMQEARAFFDLLDCDGSGSLDLEEFVFGIQRLCGRPRCFDLALVLHTQAKFIETWEVQAPWTWKSLCLASSGCAGGRAASTWRLSSTRRLNSSRPGRCRLPGPGRVCVWHPAVVRA